MDSLRKLNEPRVLDNADYNWLVQAFNEMLDDYRMLSTQVTLLRRKAEDIFGTSQESVSTFWAQITAYDYADGTGVNPYRYVYGFEEQVLTGDGYGGWENAENARYCELPCENPARNARENMNTSAMVTILSNGVARASLVGTFTLVPAPIGLLVLMHEIVVGETTTYWFEHDNGIDGDCP